MEIKIKGVKNNSLNLIIEDKYVGTLDNDHREVFIECPIKYSDSEIVAAINEYYSLCENDLNFINYRIINDALYAVENGCLFSTGECFSTDVTFFGTLEEAKEEFEWLKKNIEEGEYVAIYEVATNNRLLFHSKQKK